MPVIKSSNRGISFIELLVSVIIIAVLAGTALPLAEKSIKNSKENQLKDNLMLMRNAIDRYYMTKHRENPEAEEFMKYPENLSALVELKYLRKIPVDPITGLKDYEIIYFVNMPEPAGVFDVRSRSKELSSKGDLYSSW